MNVIFIVLFCLVTRLPQLLSPNMLLDGDEAVVGLMAKHLHDGKGIPVFFYGQAYGFSLLENATIAIAYSIAGVSDYAVKISALLFWTIGIIFFYLSFLQIAPKRRMSAMLITLAFVVSPAWAVWSMKARGGYSTAFMLFPLLLLLLLDDGLSAKKGIWFIMGLLFALIWYSQPLWIPGLIPFFAYRKLKGHKWSTYLYFIPGALLVALPLSMLQQHAPNYWERPQMVFSFSHFFEQAVQFPKYLYHGMYGYYEQSLMMPRPLSAAVMGGFIACVIFFLLLAGIYNAFTRKRNWLFITSVCALALSIVAVLLLDKNESPRWLLAIPCFAIFSLFIFVSMLPQKRIISIGLSAYICLGCFVLWGFRNYAFNPINRPQLLGTIKELQAGGIRYAYAIGDPSFQIPFYSGEQIICRPKNKPDRYMPYIYESDSALAAGLPVAYVFYKDLDRSTNKAAGLEFILSTSKQDLQKAGFHF